MNMCCAAFREGLRDCCGGFAGLLWLVCGIIVEGLRVEGRRGFHWRQYRMVGLRFAIKVWD